MKLFKFFSLSLYFQGAHIWYIPSTIFGSLCISTIFWLALLPETKDKPTYNTVKEMSRAEKTELTLELGNESL